MHTSSCFYTTCCLGIEVLTDGIRILEIAGSGNGTVVADNGAVKVMVNGREVVLFLWSQQLFCADARCPHMGKCALILYNVSSIL